MIRIWIDADEVVRLEARGQLDAAQVIAEHERFYTEEWDAYVAAELHLADYRETDLSAIEPSMIRSLAARSVEIAKARPPLRVAVLMDEGVGYGLARMWELHAETTGWPLKVFTLEAEARKWLHESDDPGF